MATVSREIDIANAMVSQIQALNGEFGTSFTAERVWSFGFPDSELSTLRVVVRPYETDFETESRGTETNKYEIEVGVFKVVNRKDITNIDAYFNLSRAIADLYPLDRQMTVGSATVYVVEKRPFPLVFRSNTIMDVETPNTRFISQWLIKFREEVEA